MRLTVDLINAALTYRNAIGETEIDLRGHKIGAIENLGAAKGNECLNLTDNDIPTLGNFPLLPDVRAVFIGHNRITTIQSNLPELIPNLTTLVLTKNRIAELADLDPLGGFKFLEFLSVKENPVTQKEHYRLWVIWRCPALRFFDFNRIRKVERDKATELFGTAAEPTELAKSIMANKTRATTAAFSTELIAPKEHDLKLTPAERDRLKEMIQNSKSLAEITRLEKYIAEGKAPPGIRGPVEPQFVYQPKAITIRGVEKNKAVEESAEKVVQEDMEEENVQPVNIENELKIDACIPLQEIEQ